MQKIFDLKYLQLHIFAVKIPGASYHLKFLAFTSKNKFFFSERSCNFEDSFCTWKNSPSSNDINGLFTKFKRVLSANISYLSYVKYDVDYPNVQIGSYLVLSNFSGGYCNCRSSFSKGLHGLLIDEYFNIDSKICAITFYAFSHENMKLEIFADSENGTDFIDRVYLRRHWQFFRISLQSFVGKKYRIMISAIVSGDCNDMVGIDKIVYEPCEEKIFPNTFKLSGTKFTNCLVECSYFSGSNSNKITNFVFESLKFNQAKPINYAVVFNTYPSKFLLRNIKFSNGQNLKFFKFMTSSLPDDKRESAITFTQNSMDNNFNTRVLEIENNYSNKTIVNFMKNSVRLCRGNEILFLFKNIHLNFWENFIDNNTLNNEMFSLDSPDSVSIISNSSFYSNSINHNAKGLFHSKCNRIRMINNIFMNPKSNYDFSTEVKKEDLVEGDLSRNWWNSLSDIDVQKRIYDGRISTGLAVMKIRPILKSKPYFPLTSQLCQNGWLFIEGFCFYLHMGSGTMDEAKSSCYYYSSYLVSQSEIDLFPLLKDQLKFVNLNNSKQYISTWTNDMSDSYSSSTMLKPWICRKGNVGLCSNRCFRHGICNGNVCICNSGWEGEDCSQFNCKAVSNCFGRGECTGPNVCQCQEGWTGNNCATSYCSRYLSCGQCIRQPGCGWCDSSLKCLPGYSNQSYLFHCDNWFYHNCLSLPNHKCSDQILKIDCNDTNCKKPTAKLIGKCNDCRMYINCYDAKNDSCATWNETKCRGGVPQIDYNNPANNIYMLKGNVLKISKTKKIFRCFSYDKLQDDKESDYEFLLIPTNRRIVKEGQVINSDQAKGIMHKALKIWRLEGNFLVIRAKFVDPLDYIEYLQVKVDMSDAKIQNPKSIDRVPTEDDMINFKESNETYKEIINEDVIKCTGKQYYYNHEPVWSYNILTKFSDVDEDDLIMFQQPKGYLEKVTNFQRTRADVFIHTRLFDCSNVIDAKTVKQLDSIVDTYPNMECDTGDSMDGLLYNEREAFKNRLELNDLIIGRSALPSLGFVLNVYQLDNDWNQIEILDMVSVTQNMNKKDYKKSFLKTVLRRKKDLRDKLQKKFSADLYSHIGVGTLLSKQKRQL